MSAELKDMIEVAKKSKDALWAQLDQIDAALAPKLAPFLDMIGLKTVKPCTCDCEGTQRCMELTWVVEGEDGIETLEFDLHRSNILAVLLEEPEEFDAYLDVEDLKQEVRKAAESLSLDLPLIASYLSEHALMFELQEGQVFLEDRIV